MVAKIVAVMAILAAFCFGVYWLYLKYALPYYQELEEKKEETKQKRLERDEKLVAHAEDEYDE